MNVLSLFDGMSCGQIALISAAIKYDNYYAAEIDKYTADERRVLEEELITKQRDISNITKKRNKLLDEYRKLTPRPKDSYSRLKKIVVIEYDNPYGGNEIKAGMNWLSIDNIQSILTNACPTVNITVKSILGERVDPDKIVIFSTK